ncbi:putative uncharacterized protein [Waddlia chondrophila 2032/99]|uniref:DUF1003 domain-containing protein n=1 Tax=Waddlia chondrophila 2032/99 TaxID=765953 RepID=F8LEU8_9BACT|nr:putative uncharacterized protein [Waddlia chondrophila 2032/99]
MYKKQHCEICKKPFFLRDLYPAVLIRDNTFEAAKKKCPEMDRKGYICFPDLRKIHASYYEEILTQERGELSKLEKEVLSSLEQHDILSENINEEFDATRTLGGRIADKVASFGGSWTFIFIFGFVLLSWMAINSYQFFFEKALDPYPYVLLNFFLSCLTTIQAPIIMMSQNRQTAKDRLTQENDYQINLKSELQIRQLNARLDMFMRHSWQKLNEISQIQEEILENLGR